jgi:hypothetical protein
MFSAILDLPARIRYRLQGGAPDYREFLFDELARRLDGRDVSRILEIGPRDGIDSRRLLKLNPKRLVLVDLPDKQERIQGWIGQLPADKVSPVKIIRSPSTKQRASSDTPGVSSTLKSSAPARIRSPG